MIYHSDSKLAFLRFPKTGSSWLRTQVLESFNNTAQTDNHHALPSRCYHVLRKRGLNPNDFEWVVGIRDPVDWFGSMYCWIYSGKRQWTTVGWGPIELLWGLHEPNGLDRFLQHFYTNVAEQVRAMYSGWTLPPNTRILRTHRLSEDFQQICVEYGRPFRELEKTNFSGNHGIIKPPFYEEICEEHRLRMRGFLLPPKVLKAFESPVLAPHLN